MVRSVVWPDKDCIISLAYNTYTTGAQHHIFQMVFCPSSDDQPLSTRKHKFLIFIHLDLGYPRQCIASIKVWDDDSGWIMVYAMLAGDVSPLTGNITAEITRITEELYFVAKGILQ